MTRGRRQLKRERTQLREQKSPSRVRKVSANDLPDDLARLAGYGVQSREDVMRLVNGRPAPRTARAIACRILGRLGGRGALEALLRQLRKASEPIVYWEAAKAIGLLGDREAIDPLGRLVNSRVEPRRRAAAAYALGMMGKRLAGKSLLEAIKMQTTPAVVRAYAVEALGVLEASGARETITALLQEDRSPRVRAAAAYALGRIGTRSTLNVLARAAKQDSAVVPYLGNVSTIAQASIREIRRNGSRRH